MQRHFRWAPWLALIAFLASGSLRANVSVPELLQRVQDPRYKVRIQAAAALAASKDRRARGAIETLLVDRDPLVRAAACDALIALGDPLAIPALDRLGKDGNDLVRRRARLAVRVLRESQRTSSDKVVANGAVNIEAVTDQSGSGFDLIGSMREGLESELKAQTVALGALKRRYALLAQVRTISTSIGDKESAVQAECHLTVTEMPRRTLRLSNQLTVKASMDGRASQQQLEGLARDAVYGAGAALIKDFSSWALVQPALPKMAR